MKAYKNWSGETRLKMYSKLKYMKKNNQLPEWVKLDGECSMCLADHKTMPHAEEYGETFDDYLKSIHVLCVRCHSMLHLRFRYIGHWVEHLEYVKQVKQGLIERKPAVAHMGIIFDQCNSWKQIPKQYLPNEKGEWWEKLTINR